MTDGLLGRQAIRARLLAIFPPGTAYRSDITNQTAAATVFVSLYIGAVVGSDRWLGPKHVYRMTEEQAALTDPEAREVYIAAIRSPTGKIVGTRWYADNSREGIRDDTLREGLVAIGAVVARTDVATTSSRPRYALTESFAALFDPAIEGASLAAAINVWQQASLNKGALARLAINLQGAGRNSDKVLVIFPNGETRLMKPGGSSELTKAVVEVFAPRFLVEPAVLSISESATKVIARDDALAKSVGLEIQADKNLPDIILADLGLEQTLLVFVEVVFTDGPISERRKAAFLEIVEKASFPPEHVAFVTAYLDRSAASFKKTVNTLAWGSYAWFASEPEGLLELTTCRKTIG